MNCVDITGRVREKIDNIYRYFEYELPYFDEPKHGPNRIVIRNWTNTENSSIIMLEGNTRVIIHAHLDVVEKFGTILVVEHLESLHTK